MELGTIGFEDVALTVVATVVSHAGGRVITNAGSKALGADRAPWATGYGRVLEAPDARIVALSEHHSTIEWPGSLPALGSQVLLVPNHVCNAVNLADSYLLTDGGTWPVGSPRAQQLMRVATVNVNGIRAATRRGFADWLAGARLRPGGAAGGALPRGTRAAGGP